jgi:hypothetical protein
MCASCHHFGRCGLWLIYSTTRRLEAVARMGRLRSAADVPECRKEPSDSRVGIVEAMEEDGSTPNRRRRALGPTPVGRLAQIPSSGRSASKGRSSFEAAGCSCVIGHRPVRQLTANSGHTSRTLNFLHSGHWNDIRGTQGIVSEPHRHLARELQLPLDRLETNTRCSPFEAHGGSMVTSLRRARRWLRC